MKYAGLTDDPERRRQEHGNPKDFLVVMEFESERVARLWEVAMLRQGYKGDTGGKGWKYGYTYSVTPKTKE
ncbi:MAG: hypothetical protein HPY65_13655 [Syntrophaceae bacterium]|nr:hypothetical protein [Syntrophaceae bacterium]